MLTVTAALLSACSNEKHNDSADSTQTVIPGAASSSTAETPEESDGLECYSFIKNKDTVSMKLHINGEEYSGELSYNFYEKDKNRGTFGGEMKGDTLIAEYTFDSEGMRSVREVVFLKKAGKLYEGYGEVLEKESKQVFKDRSKLKFGDAVILDKVTCN